MKKFPIKINPPVTIYNTKFATKSLQGKICLSPFVSMHVDLEGNVRLCGCFSWMPIAVGNLFDETLDQILANTLSQDIRRSVSQGTYDYCNEKVCGVINSNGLIDYDILSTEHRQQIDNPDQFQIPHEIQVSGDETCNLSCPSCRLEIKKNSDETIKHNEQLGEQLRANLFSRPSNAPIRLHVSTSGEIFASPLLLSFVNSIPPDDFPNLRLCIQTNGLLAEKFWHKLGVWQDRVDKITVTTDAARPGTYERLRRGGTWPEIQRALSWIADKKKSNGMQLHLRMVVQQENYKEMLEFYQQAAVLGADMIEYARIHNWAIFTKEEFDLIDVFSSRHPELDQAQDILNQVRCLPNVFLCGGL